MTVQHTDTGLRCKHTPTTTRRSIKKSTFATPRSFASPSTCEGEGLLNVKVVRRASPSDCRTTLSSPPSLSPQSSPSAHSPQSCSAIGISSPQPPQAPSPSAPQPPSSQSCSLPPTAQLHPRMAFVNEGRKSSFFNDQMAGEGETSHVAVITRLMYAALLAYSVLTSIVTGAPWWTQMAFYLTFLCCFYLWHWMAHQKWSGPMHEIHCIHHWKVFPPSQFYGDGTQDAKTLGFRQLMDLRNSKFRLAHEGPLYLMLVLVAAVSKMVLGCSWPTIGCALLLGAVMGGVGSALHASYHIRDFALERFQWYKELRALHYIHHLGDTKHNYGVLNIELIDGVFQSVMLTDPRRKAKVVAMERVPSDTLKMHIM